ncbi:MAG TPA: polysaccharide biosynthesis C-terminal domain-containing protein, partial [Anaerolineae bacterium]|nr:polysaccharide biosynthesis C-terminal domain-containing protein [Anaerolineae bacterium]
RSEERKKYYGTVWLLTTLIAVGMSLLIEVVGPSLSPLLFPDVPYAPYIRLAVWTTAITNSSFLLLRSVLRVREKPLAFVALNVSVFLTNTAFIIYFVVGRGRGALGSVQGHFAASLALGVPVILLFLRSARLSWSWEKARASLAFAVPLIPHLLSLWILNLSDRFVLQRYVSLDDVGIYNLGYQAASVVQLLAFSAMNAWSPFFYRTADEPGAPRLLSRFSTYYWLAVAFLGTGLIAVARDGLAIIATRPAYHVAYLVVPWVVLGFVMRGFYFVFVTALYHTKRVKALPLVTVLSGLLNIGLNLLFVPRYGYMAAAVNTFVAYVFQAIVMYFLAQRAYPMPYETSRVLKILGVGAALYLATLAVPSMPAWAGLFVKGGIVVTYPLWLTLLGFWTEDERAAFGRLVRRFTGRMQDKDVEKAGPASSPESPGPGPSGKS